MSRRSRFDLSQHVGFIVFMVLFAAPLICCRAEILQFFNGETNPHNSVAAPSPQKEVPANPSSAETLGEKDLENPIQLNPPVIPETKAVVGKAAGKLESLPIISAKSSEPAFLSAPPDKTRKKHYVFIEAEDCFQIEPSFKIASDSKCSGGKYLTHPENTGSSWAKEGVGSAKYILNIPETGIYQLWSLVKWESGCSDCFFVFIDDKRPAVKEGIFSGSGMLLESHGKDMTLYSWHWINWRTFTLEKGNHVLELKNQDDGSHIDKMLLTNDDGYVPQGIFEWVYERNFDDNSARGWTFSEKDWKNDNTGSGAGLEKTGVTHSPVKSGMLNCGEFYFSCELSGAEDFKLVCDGDSSKNTSFTLKRLGDKELSCSISEDGKIISEGKVKVINPARIRLELFNAKAFSALCVDGISVLFVNKASSSSITIKKISFDMNKTAKISDLFMSPMGEFHSGENFYFEPGPVNFRFAKGKWERIDNGMRASTDGGTILTGEQWWSNFQFTFMFFPPEKGKSSILFSHKDLDNTYSLDISGNEISLFKTKSGKATRLAGAQAKLIKAKNDKISDNFYKNRISIFMYNGEILVFLNGRQVIQASDKDFLSGEMGFQSDAANSFIVDDVEISSIPKLPEEKENEPISWFSMKPLKIVDCVLDNVTSTGYPRQGEERSTVKDSGLGKLTAELTNSPVKADARVLDKQFLSFNGLFEEKCGFGKGEGYMLFNSLIAKNNRDILWMEDIFYGDWNMSFNITGGAEKISLIFVEESGNWEHKSIEIKLPVASIQSGDQIKWYEVKAEKSNDKILLFVDGKVSGEIAIEKNVFVRPGIMMSSGYARLDDIFCELLPDYLYEFQFNQPYALEMSDWENRSDNTLFMGGYYSSIRLQREKKDSFLTSKRIFSLGFTLLTTLGSKEQSAIRFNIVRPDNGMISESVSIYRSAVMHQVGDQLLKKAELKDFLGDGNEFKTVCFSIKKNGAIQIYLCDGLGARLALDSKLMCPLKKFRLQIESSPLDVKRIAIWESR